MVGEETLKEVDSRTKPVDDHLFKKDMPRDAEKSAVKGSKAKQMSVTKMSKVEKVSLTRSKVNPFSESRKHSGDGRKRRTKTSQEEIEFSKMVDKYRQKFRLQTLAD